MSDIPTARELHWAGEVWDGSQAIDCQAFYWMAFQYASGAESFCTCKWADIGVANQLEITRALLRVENTLARAHR